MNKRRNLFLICLFAVLLGSCNFNSVEINEPLLKLDAVIVNDKISRTALPTYSASELTDIVFSSRITGETEYGILQEWNSFSEMQDSKLKMKSGTYDFKLEGKIGCNEFEGEILSCVIDKVESRLTVELSLTNSFIGEGEIQISLSYPASSVELGIPEVKEVTVELLDFERTNVVEEENALEISENTVKYNSGKKYADGNYWVVFRLYADENRKLLLNEKTELAVVKDAGISKSSLKFENLDKIYTVTCYDGTEVLKTFEYTKRSGIKFVNEDFQKEGYALVGLYETSDFTGTAVEEYQVGTTGNKILFTNWEMGVSYTVEVYLQSLDCENYEYDTTLKTLWAKNGDVISSYADNISYEGYQLQTIEPITLDATSESNVLKLKFNRKTVTITLKKDANTEYKVLSGPYGTNIESFDVPESDSENLIFVGWTKDDVDIILETYPIEDCVYIAKWIDCSITSFTAKASSIGVNYTGVIPVEIIGTNLDDIYQLFKWEGGIPTNFISISDKKITAEVELHDYTTGEKSLKISCGSLTASTTVTVLSEDESFSVGDILFSDGTKIKAEDIQYGITEEQKAKAIAVITSTKYDGGVGIGVGIQRSSSTLAWAPNLTTGRNKNFTGIYGTTTSGDMDGSDNWEYICSQDSNGILNASTNYPAFNFANNYGTTAGLTETDYAEGWYVPSAAELYNITCTYRTKIQSSLDAVSGFTIGSTDYWSSSQSSYTSDALVVYNSGYFSTSKSNNYYVLAVRKFDWIDFSN